MPDIYARRLKVNVIFSYVVDRQMMQERQITYLINKIHLVTADHSLFVQMQKMRANSGNDFSNVPPHRAHNTQSLWLVNYVICLRTNTN